MSHYDAATPPTSTATLAQMADRSEAVEVARLLDDVTELTTQIGEYLSAEPLTDQELAALEAVTGAEEAPLGFRSLHRRVHEGLLTWERFWANPSAEGPVGRQVVLAVLSHLTDPAGGAETVETDADRSAGDRRG